MEGNDPRGPEHGQARQDGPGSGQQRAEVLTDGERTVRSGSSDTTESPWPPRQRDERSGQPGTLDRSLRIIDNRPSVPLARVTTSLKRDQVVDLLRQAILDGDLRPGDRIVELSVAKQLGVSQTPVREALAALSKEGLVVKLDHIGTFVASLNQVELRELLTLRAVLEGYCARLAAELLAASDIPRLEALLEQMRAAAREVDMQSLIEADLAFHELLYDVCGHRLLREVLSGLQQRMRLALAFADSVYSADLGDVADSHRAVIDALESRDPTVAERVAQEHVLAVLGLIGVDVSASA